ncbi:MAG: hypothetical protein U5L07_10465 [Desulfobacterales bacterium]|nr:hypothetical protein [Desulfobacterales bacterium]
MKKYTLISICLLFLVSCAAPPHEAVIQNAGPYPENYREMIKGYLGQTLQNPESLKDFNALKPAEIVTLDTYYGFIPLYEGQKVWEIFITFDVKNANGKYIGPDMHVVWIRHNRIVAYDYDEVELDYRVKKRLGGS